MIEDISQVERRVTYKIVERRAIYHILAHILNRRVIL